jgi:prepilin-type processing-associated H-X9-DG protein/prepilin-type N-terminal cleavage/methylation domain-containing protein
MNRQTTMPGATQEAERGFTLVELLVVVAIIALMAGVLLPAYARATRNTRAIGCLNNLEQISRAVAMYSEEDQNYFPQVFPWWSLGPYYSGNSTSNIGQAYNTTGDQIGGEWLCKNAGSGWSGSGTCQPNTVAPMLASYLPNNMVWVCPKRRRGMSYVKAGVTVGNLDPSKTGFLSYGFNEIGVFSRLTPDVSILNADHQMDATDHTPEFKSSRVSQPANTVAICEVSGSNDPSSSAADAAWLDTVWWSNTGPGQTYNFGDMGRVHCAYARHNNRVNVLYVDGHVAPSLPSALTWGQFWGYFGPSQALTGNGMTHVSDQFISTPTLDSLVWSGSPE